VEIVTAKKENLSVVLNNLREGKIIICPTDTVYGLLCDAANEKAVGKIFEIKKRDKSKPLAVFVKDIKMAERFASINESQKKFLKKNWPGAVTVILKAKKGLAKLTYKNNKIGLRVPDYGFLGLVLRDFGKPIAQTSANISGKPAVVKIKEVFDQFKSIDVKPDLMIDEGDLPKNKPSKVMDLTEGKIKTLRK